MMVVVLAVMPFCALNLLMWLLFDRGNAHSLLFLRLSPQSFANSLIPRDHVRVRL